MGLPSRFAVSGHHFDSSPSDLAASLRSLGARGIDVWPWNLGDDHHSAAAAFAASGLQIITINVPGATARLCDPAGDEALVEAANDAIDLAVELGAPMVSLYAAPGTSRNALSASDELASSLAAVLERAELSHVTLTVENNLDQRGEDLHRSNPSRSPEVLARTMQLLDSKWVGIAFDPCNFTTVLTEPYPYAYELLRPWIRNVHIKDCTRYDPARHRALPARNKLLIDSHGGAHLPRPVGSGAVPWPQIIDELANDGYAGWWTLDPFITASELAAWCRESVSWLEGYRAFADPAHHEVTGPTRGPSSEPLEAPSR